MILKSLKILSQNIYKNKLLTDTFIKNYKDCNILFIQEPSWFIVHYIPYASSEEGKEIIEALNHPSWILFVRNSKNMNYFPRVLTYINARLTRLYFSLRKDIINHKDINLVFFFNDRSICFLINLKYLKDTEVNLNSILIIIRDFNISDNNWDQLYSYHSNYTDALKEIADSFNLELSTPVNQVLM